MAGQVDMDNSKSIKIQIIRGLAIMAVVGIHSHISYYGGIWIRPFLNFAVGTFLFLSGYLTSKDITSPFDFCKKRILRVLIPYTFWSVIYTMIYNSWGSFWKNYLIGNACDIYYYIIVYIQIVLITPILIRLINSRFWALGFAPNVIYLIVKYVIAMRGADIPGIFNINFFYSWTAFYYLGLCHARRRIDIRKIPLAIYIFAWIILSGIQVLEGHLWLGYFGILPLNYSLAVSQQKISAVLTTLIFDCMIVYFIECKKSIPFMGGLKHIAGDIFAKIGDASFGIYLIHVMLLMVLNSYLYNRVLNVFPINMFITTLLCSVLVLGIGRILKAVLGDIVGIRIIRWLGF